MFLDLKLVRIGVISFHNLLPDCGTVVQGLDISKDKELNGPIKGVHEQIGHLREKKIILLRIEVKQPRSRVNGHREVSGNLLPSGITPWK